MNRRRILERDLDMASGDNWNAVHQNHGPGNR